MTDLTAHFYPNPTDDVVVCSDIVEVLDSAGNELISDCIPYEHPEVPLSGEDRDRELARLGYCRIGPYVESGSGVEAPVKPR